jgi:two-component system LytT family response regulator
MLAIPNMCSNSTAIHFKDHPKLIASRILVDFEEILPSDIFYCPHLSFVINLNHIKRYIKGDGGQIEMEGGHHVDVSRSKKEEFIKLIRT